MKMYVKPELTLSSDKMENVALLSGDRNDFGEGGFHGEQHPQKPNQPGRPGRPDRPGRNDWF